MQRGARGHFRRRGIDVGFQFPITPHIVPARIQGEARPVKGPFRYETN